MKLFDVYPMLDVTIDRAKGEQVFDDTGKAYLDLYGGHAVISIGHCHPHYVNSIESQLHKIGFYSNAVHNDLQVALASHLGRLGGVDQYHLFLSNSGAEANENALKMASYHNGREKFIAFRKSFHGRTSAAMGLTDNPRIQTPFSSSIPVEWYDLNQIASVEASLARGDIAAVIIEGIQGVGGIHIPTDDFLRALSAACKKYDTPLILDEIQSGAGRSGTFFAFQTSGIEPDIITSAKGLGNGFPIGATLIHPKFEAKHGLLGTTFGGNHLACAAALAVLEVIEQEELMEKSHILGAYTMEKLREIPQISEVRGKGLMIGIQLDQPVAPIRKRLFQDYQILTGNSSDPNVIRLLPPLNVKKDSLDHFVNVLKTILQS